MSVQEIQSLTQQFCDAFNKKDLTPFMETSCPRRSPFFALRSLLWKQSEPGSASCR